MRHFTAFAVLVCLPLITLGPALAADAKDEPGRSKLLVVPSVPVGEVRAVQEKRVAKAIADQMATSGAFDIATDKDKVADKVDGKKGAPKISTASKRIEAADAVRQEGADLLTDGKAVEALDKLRDAIGLYSKAYLELVDYGKLADAYASAAEAAFQAGRSEGEIVGLLEDGLAIQPTLVVNSRKKANAPLVELLVKTRARLDARPKAAVIVEGPPTPGLEVFVDGVKLSDLPAKAEGLIPGTHYAQIRGEGLVPWGTVVKLNGKDIKVQAKIVAIKVEEQKVVAPLTVAALADCARTGMFHLPVCKTPAATLARQTGASHFLFSALKPDRFGRLTIHCFLMEIASASTVTLKPIELAADLGDLNRRTADLEGDVSAAVQSFPKARALSKIPTAYSAK